MPKSRKKKNADFQKVKLKVGKAKKSSSEVNVSFKTRTIKVSQSLKNFSSNAEEPQTKRRLKFEDLLKQCDANKSCSQRLSAIEGFRELALDTGTGTVVSNLSYMMTRVAGLLNDPEPVVRQAVVRLCKTVFPLVSDENCGFFEYFSAQLCCAMTHISDDVRRDSLLLFDMLLKKYPQKVIDQFCRLVPSLIDQICTHILTGKAGKRSLAFNPHSKLSSQQWRTEVLQRLWTIVDVYVDKHQEDMGPADDASDVYHVGKDYPVVRGPSVPPHIQKMWTAWPRNRLTGGKLQEYSYLTRQADSLQKFISSILPLVKQCWTEEFSLEGISTAFHTAPDSGRLLTQESLPLLTAVVGLLHALVECWRCVESYKKKRYSESQWFHQELRDLLLPYFPITLTEKIPKGKKGAVAKAQRDGDKSANLQTSVLKLNLLICEMLASFRPLEENRPLVSTAGEDWHKVIVSFLLKNLKLCTGPDLSKCLATVLLRVFSNFPANKKQDKLLTKAQKRFIKAHPLSMGKRMYLDLFHQLAFDVDEESPYHAHLVDSGGRHEMLETFFQALPQLLLQLGGLDNAERMACEVSKAMCHHSSKLLTAAVQQHMDQFLDTETGVFMTLPESCHENMIQAFKWAYHNTPVPEHILDLVGHLVCHPKMGKETARKLVEGLHQKFDRLMKDSRHFDLPKRQEIEASRKSYIRFILGILMGHRRVELEAFDNTNTWERGGLTRILWLGSMEQMEKHQHVLKLSRGFFHSYYQNQQSSSSSSLSSNVMEVVANTWTLRILNKYCALSIFTVYGALIHWLHSMAPLSDSEAFHIDNAPIPAVYGDNIAMWQQRARQMVPVFKANMRPFAKLAFSLMYSVVSMETSEEETTLPEARMMKTMVDLVLTVMDTSLMMMLDMMQVMSDFVRGEHSEKESMKAVLVMTQLMTAEKLDNLRHMYKDQVRTQLSHFMETVQTTGLVEEQQWWKNFISTCSITFQ